jgi:hypothetical protein
MHTYISGSRSLLWILAPFECLCWLFVRTENLPPPASAGCDWAVDLFRQACLLLAVGKRENEGTEGKGVEANTSNSDQQQTQRPTA